MARYCADRAILISIENNIMFDVIIADEAHRISNPKTKTYKAVNNLCSKKRIALTGTPIQNKPLDIYGIINWLHPGYLGDYYSFEREYCIFDDNFDRTWRVVQGYKNLDKLAKKIEPIMIRKTKEEVFNDFPLKTSENIVFDLSREEREVYKAIKNQIFLELQKLKIEGHNLHVIPVKMLRLLQATCDTRLITENAPESSKLKVLKELLQPIVESGDKAIIFCQFAEMVKLLSIELSEYNPLVIFGDISEIDRFKAVKKFNEDDENKVFILSEAGSYGLNLQNKASYVFHYSLPWSIAKLEQREGRVHRIGQTKNVTSYTLTARETIDEYVAKVLHKKQGISDEILQDTRITTEDMDAILN